MESSNKRVVDIRRLGLKALQFTLPCTSDVKSVIADENEINKIENLKKVESTLVQLSLSQNKLTATAGLQGMKCLRVLNLSKNKISLLTSFENLVSLEWLSLSGNCLQNINAVADCPRVIHCDCSDNRLTLLPALINLRLLHTLLLHGNLIQDLTEAQGKLPRNLAILSLAENKIEDLNQVKYLTSFDGLEQLSIMNNPCLMKETLHSLSLNYRPFVVNWCESLTILDGVPVTKSEKSQAEDLCYRGNGRSFTVGQHAELIHYLSNMCPGYWKEDDYSYVDGDSNNSDKAALKQNLSHSKEMRYRTRRPQDSPRFQTGRGERQIASTEGGGSSMFPLHARVSESEKRKRVHAWLGAQFTGAEPMSTSFEDSPTSNYVPSRNRAMPSPEKSEFSKNSKHDKRLKEEMIERTFGRKQDNAHETSHVQSYYAKHHLLNDDSMVEKSLQPSGIVPETLSDVYHSTMAQEYTKKYAVSPSINSTSVSQYHKPKQTDYHLPSHSEFVKYRPYSVAFTSTDHKTKYDAMKSFSRPGEDYASKIHGIDHTEELSLPTKYQEYDSRPIKPLDSEIKRSIYGDSTPISTNKDDKVLPRAYLRKGQSSLRHSKYRSKSLGSDARKMKPVTRVQSNMEMEKVSNLSADDLSPPTVVSSALVGDQCRSLDEMGKLDTKKIVEQSEISTDILRYDEDRTENVVKGEKTEMINLLFPVDLKHVKAATKIQSIWRGYRARKCDTRVMEIRQEVRARRSEQYISFLCHEVQLLQNKLEAEHKMRDLQTEAIRYIWSHVRQLQKHDGSGRNFDKKRKSDNRRCGSPSRSPRRGKTRTSKMSTPQTSPTATPRNGKSPVRSSKAPPSRSVDSPSDFGDETDSIASCSPSGIPQKKPDVTWRDDADAALFDHKTTETPSKTEKQSITRQEQNADDTDEGRGTIVTDGEGNAMLSSAEDTDAVQMKSSSDNLNIQAENKHLKSTVELLQHQVVQLQEAMLTLSDQILNRSYGDGFHGDEQEAEDSEDLRLVPDNTSCSPASKNSPVSERVAFVESKERKRSASKERLPAVPRAISPVANSAAGYLPKMTIKNMLTSLQSSLSETELWAICEQAAYSIKKAKTPSKYYALETVLVRKDGVVECVPDDPNCIIDEMYLAPELLDEVTSPTVKSAIFSLSVCLWSAADWEMAADQAPQLSQELESLLVVMSQDEVEQRADIDDVLKICQDYHARVGKNSLAVCSSLIAEVRDALSLNETHKKNRAAIAREVSVEQESRTRALFRNNVVPDINTFSCQINLKPASKRVLSPKPPPTPSIHEELMTSIRVSKSVLKQSPRPKVFSVCDMFQKNPELVRNLNILPGQRRRNMKAMRLVMRRQTPRDPVSPPKAGIPTPPKALRAEVKDNATPTKRHASEPGASLCSVVLRWHPSKIYDKHGQECSADKIIGYRIYVNGHPKGMVAGTKYRALLEGLRQSTEYRVHVRSLSAIGESDASNTVIAHITPSLDQDLPKASWKTQTDFVGSVLSPLSEKESEMKQSVPHAFPRKNLPGNALNAHNGEGDGATSTIASSNDSCVSSANSIRNTTKGEDIIDRVLRRYGIQQTASIVPGFSCGSSLPPMPASLESVMSSSKKTGLNESTEKIKEKKDSKNSSFGSVINTEKNSSSKAEEDFIQSEITPRSLALLAQLKDDLCQ